MRLYLVILGLILSFTILPHGVEATSTERQAIICKRIEKKAQTNRLEKINERLQNRLGFRCNFGGFSTENDSNGIFKKTPLPSSGSLPFTFSAINDWQSYWNVYTREIPNEVPYFIDNIEIIENDDKFPQFIRVHFPAGSGSPHVAYNYNRKPAGILARFTGGVPTGHDDLYLRYYFRIPTNFPSIEGLGLPGLFGGLTMEPDGRGRFETGIILNKRGQITISGRYEQKFRANAAHISPQSIVANNQWHRIDMHLVLNDITDEKKIPQNGSVQVWLDGEKAILEDGILFRGNERYTIDGLYFLSLFGSTKLNDLVKEASYIDFADITVSDKLVQ